MTSLKLTDYDTKAELPLIVRIPNPQATGLNRDEPAHPDHADLFNMARGIYLRSRRRRGLRRSVNTL